MDHPVFEVAVDSSHYMLRLAASPMGRAYKQAAIAGLRLELGDTIVDLGCGPGADLLAFADAVGPTGMVLGIDHDQDALARAREDTAGRPEIEVRLGDIRVITLPPGAADAVHADRVLQHVPEPERAVFEAARLLKPGGRAVLAEPDWHTLIVDHPEPSLTDAYTRYVTGHQIRNPRIGSQLPRLLGDANLMVETIEPVTAVFTDRHVADRVLGFRRVTERAVATGAMSDAQAADWLRHLAGGSFFASLTLFLVTASKPSLD